MNDLLPRLPFIPLGLALMVGACAVFNPKHVNLNPFTAPNPCSPPMTTSLYDGTPEDLAMQDLDEAYAARLAKAANERCRKWRWAHDPTYTVDELRQRMKEYEALPGW
jgi:hypothetical protein